MELENADIEFEIEMQESGPQGEPGPQGLSAYEIYLANGGELSETEWLESLKGEPGPPGESGATYTAGENIIIDENNVISAEEPIKTFVIEAKISEVLSTIMLVLTDEGKATLQELVDYHFAYNQHYKLIIKNTDSYKHKFIELVRTATEGSASILMEGHYQTSDNITKYFIATINFDMNTKKYKTSALITYKYNNVTKEYVDDSIANAESIPTVEMTSCSFPYSGGSVVYNTEENCTNLSEFINKIYQNKYIGPIKVQTPNQVDTKILNPSFEGITNTVNSYLYTLTTQEETYNYISTSYYRLPIRIYHLYIEGTWENDVFTCTGYRYEKTKSYNIPTVDNVLTKKSPKEFTPTSDYHPATKKYVDDNSYEKPIKTFMLNIEIPNATSTTKYIAANTISDADRETINSMFTYALADNGPYKLIIKNTTTNRATQTFELNQRGVFTTASSALLFDHNSVNTTYWYNTELCFHIDKTNSQLKTSGTAITVRTEVKQLSTYATKKYVDDSIAAAITTVLEGEY